MMQNLCNYIPLQLIIRGRGPSGNTVNFDVAFITVAEMDKNGYFNYGLCNSLTGAVFE